MALQKMSTKILPHTIQADQYAYPVPSCVCAKRLGLAKFLETHNFTGKKRKRFSRIRENNENVTANSKHYGERQRNCNYSIMFSHLMTSKLIYLLMDCEILNPFVPKHAFSSP